MAILLVPQSLAYARLAGMPPYIGLYAAALPPLAAAFFASSPYLQTGPVALTSLLTFGALSTLAPPGSPEYVQLGGLLAVVVGVTRVGIGFFKAGDVAFLMSEPVGVEVDGGVLGSAAATLGQAGSWELEAMGLSALTLLLIVGGRRLHPLVPGVPLAAAAGIVATLLLGYPGSVMGEIPARLPPITLDLPWRQLPRIALAGVVIAFVGFAEAASIARI